MKMALAFAAALIPASAMAAPSGIAWTNGQRLDAATLQKFDNLKANQSGMDSLQANKLNRIGDTSTNQKLVGAQIPTAPSDAPGATSAAVPNTAWVDSYYTPRNWWEPGQVITVCPSGCDYAVLHAAWVEALRRAHLLLNPQGRPITISVSDGSYDEPWQIFSQDPLGEYIQVIGDVEDKTKVVVNFTDISGTGNSGFVAIEGGNIGLIDGITLRAIGAISSQSSNAIRWVANSHGAGILARGGVITVGSNVAIDGFYYGLVGDHGGIVRASRVSVSRAGDVGVFAKFGGVVMCSQCTSTNIADSDSNLGCGFMSEQGGHLDIDGSRSSGTLYGAVCSISGGNVWANNFVGTGGLGGTVGSGIWTLNGGSIQAEQSAFSGYANGAWAQYGSSIDVIGASFTGNSEDGILADGGTVYGGATKIQNNGAIGVNLLHGANVQLWNSLSLITGNAGGAASVSPAGTANGYTYTASSLFVD